ncbi:MAG: SRPBCC family protein [Candidatus Odinarchaeota archaeon]
MPRIERKIDIETTPEKIYKIVTDGFNTPKWNLVVESVVEINGNKIQLDTDIGGVTINKTETEENKNVTWFTENSELNSIGYIMTPKKEKTTRVSIWTEFNDKKRSKLFKETADNVLLGLKSYAEYLEDGGDPELYKKWEVITTP